MRIVQITSSRLGGAGVAANSLNAALNNHGHLSTTLDRESIRSTERNLVNRGKNILSKFNTTINQLSAENDYGFVSPGSVNFVSINEIKELGPDVIHIHNWYNLLSLDTIRKLGEEFRIVMTLHDTRLISGGCHVFNGCTSYKNHCEKCPAVKFGGKRIMTAKEKTHETIMQISNLRVISPSEWLADEFESTFPGLKTAVIPNLVKPEFLNAAPVKLPEKITNICFISAKLDAPFKGLHLLIEGLELLSGRNPEYLNTSLTLIGECEKTNQLKSDKIKIKYVGNLAGRDLVVEMQKNHLVIVPSTSDNFPSVIAEAQLLGIPVLGTRIGGIPEMIQHGYSGLLCDPSAESISTAIESVPQISLSNMALQARQAALTKYDPDLILNKHLSIYQGFEND